MKVHVDGDQQSRNIAQRQQQFQRDEFRTALRTLLMSPLLSPAHEDFSTVRRQAEPLRDWFARETGWTLEAERGGARLYKRPADLSSATRGLPDYDRRRYVLLCLACAVLERAEAQVTLRILGERLLLLAAEPTLTSLGFTFTLAAQHERRELVAVCRTLLELGVLQRVAGDEEAFVHAGGDQADALYDVQRRALSGMLAVVRGPSTWRPEDAPVSLDERLHALVTEHAADSDEARRTAIRHQLARRLLDDPVVYLDSLDTESRAYFANQRGAMALRLCDAVGLVAEQRAEGLALVDDSGALTDVAMPAEGTDAHATLLVAEYLASSCRQQQAHVSPTAQSLAEFTATTDIVDFLREAKGRYGRYWRKSAREPGAEHELAEIAIGRLEKLQLIVRNNNGVCPLPALARFALGDAEIRDASGARDNSSVEPA
ncbi:TIGR02678 family protein [Hyphomicrobium sp. CS1BSMeth3]|uniref:TIGR02678 family protein n=1 Tax=Hyphomicrobium sp. CS1BSMeth3 TaxID=1892844 RepID=UPI0009300CF3|nr:TIGR02678 family protein [Hyphomicrobium sp. CS1BSMeth3]